MMLTTSTTSPATAVATALAERWLDITGYIGRYRVSDLGNVYSCLTERILKPAPTSRGYLTVNLYDGSIPKRSRSFCVHDLVAEAFIGPKPDGAHVDHVKQPKTNNAVTNLEYVTPAENNRRARVNGLHRTAHGSAHPNSKLNERNALSILRIAAWRSRFDAQPRFASNCALGRKFGVSETTIASVVNRKTFAHVKVSVWLAARLNFPRPLTASEGVTA